MMLDRRWVMLCRSRTVVLLVVLIGCAGARPSEPATPQSRTKLVEAHPERATADIRLPSDTIVGLDEALERGITEEGLRNDVEILASDAFLGRAPGTEGETKTLAFLSDAFKTLGLTPAGEQGSYLTKVPLIGAYSSAQMRIRTKTNVLTASAPDDFVAHSRTGKDEVTLKDVPIIFVGYGVVAKEFAWDDFKDVDVQGKLLVMLVGDPPVVDPKDPQRLDDATFGGRAMTYYGRWTYKYEIASQRGARGVLLVHEAGPAGYGYDVVKAGALKEQLFLEEDKKGRVDVEGWMSEAFARKLFAQAGQDFDALKQGALSRTARPVPLATNATLRVQSQLRRFESHNALAALPGKNPEEAIVVTAHWDHLGHDEGRKGDGIFNGAIDNASGVASLLAIARALSSLPTKLNRTVVFLSPTAEESGLLGAKRYAAEPYVPLSQTLANVNMDCMNLWGRAHAIVSVGQGTSSLDEVLSEEARHVGRVVVGDPEPEKGYFFRSDHLELMRKGVPALHFLHPGAEYEGRSPAEGAALRSAYVSHDYHKVSDQPGPALRYDGASADAKLLARVIIDISQSSTAPTWKAGSAFSR